MRVALLSYEFGEYCVRLAAGLSDRHEVLLVLPNEELKHYSRLLPESVEVAAFDKPRLRQASAHLRRGRRIVERIDLFGPDVVHVQHGQFWLTPFWRSLKRWPLVVTAHDANHHPGDAASRRVPQSVLHHGFRQADQVIIHAKSMTDETLGTGVGRDRISVVPHVELGPPPQSRVSASARDQRTVLFFGRIWPYKGLDILLRAEPALRAQFPDLKVKVAGQGEDLGPYRALVESDADVTFFEGHISDSDRDDLFRSSTVIALPYREASTSGVVPLAFAHRLPVVASAIGGLPEQVEDGVTGLLVEPDSPVALQRALAKVLGDEDLRNGLAERAEQHVRSEWSQESVAIRTAAVYERAVDQRDTRRPGAPAAQVHVVHIGSDPHETGGIQSVIRSHLRLPFTDVSAANVVSHRERSPAFSIEAVPSAVVMLLRHAWHLRGAAVVAHVHLADGGSYLREGSYAWLARLLGWRVVLTHHGAQFADFATRHPRAIAWTFRSGHVVHALGNTSRTELQDHVGPLLVSVAPNWVDVPETEPRAAGDNPPVVLFGGANGTRKGLDVLLEGWPAVRAALPDAVLRVAGPPADVDPRGCDGVEVLGDLSPERLLAELDRCRLAVLPSRAEVMPMFLIEAAARGRPAIATDVADIAETLPDRAGLVPIGDSAALATSLIAWLDDPDRCTKSGTAAHSLAIQKFSVQAATATYRAMYAEALGSGAL